MSDVETQQWCKLLRVDADTPAIEVCHAFEQMAARVLAPIDLKECPIYCMPTSVLPEEFTIASRHTGGWCGAWAYMWLREHLPADRGAGPVLIVHDADTEERAITVAKEVEQLSLSRGKERTIPEIMEVIQVAFSNGITSICQVLTHELGHAIDRLVDDDILFTGMNVLADSKKFKAKAIERFDDLVERKRREDVSPPYQQDCHGLAFTRIVAHLDYRLYIAGVDASNLRAADKWFNQAPYAECCRALGDELPQYRNTSFADILSLPMPKAFEQCAIEPTEPVNAVA